MLVLQALTISFTFVLVHGLSATIMICTSTECRKGCKSLLNSWIFLFRTGRVLNESPKSNSKKDKALWQAKRATEWRRKQTCDVMKKVSPLIGTTNPEMIMSNLRVRQELSAPTGLQGLEATTHPVDNSVKENVRFAEIIHVKPFGTPQAEFERERQVHDSKTSELLLRCNQLKLMDNLDDPVHAITDFQRPGRKRWNKLKSIYISGLPRRSNRNGNARAERPV